MQWLVAVVIWLNAGMSCAGAWPREAGTFFVALTADQSRAKIYAEYGLRDDWTIGVEATSPKDTRIPEVTSFVRHPILRFKSGAILSAGLAVEQRETQAAANYSELAGTKELALRLGLFWGKGFATHWGNAWATVEAQVEQLMTDDWLDAAKSLKLDATLGIKPADRLILFAQAQGWQRLGDDRSLRLETSAAWAIGQAHLVLSPSINLTGDRDARVKLGVWLKF